ncbi:DNA topoisomerase IB [Benzoatithermus flavus]|uniref:DNA topoisomerase n=1 Tax=Benzoatithermus flavus TaxID=3108223 RepID=A0ABU8XV61_9PROT
MEATTRAGPDRPVVPPPAADEPLAAASDVAREELRELGLRYVSDAMPGITRRRAGSGFAYRQPDGRPLKDEDTLRWIRRLALPPAWRQVWISPFRDGHLLATGRDAKGRKQYRYHPRWRAIRDEAKFDRMLAFGRALPRIRAEVEAEMKRPGLGKRKVVATVVHLLETTLIRVGNDEYAKANRTFGLTTMRDRHFKAEGSRLRFSFRGKGGKRHVITLKSRRLAQLVRRMQELPGQELFQYVDEEGRPQPIDSSDVNAYLREVGGSDFTAKDFRTWAGTVLAAWALSEFEAFDSQAAAKRNVTQAIERVASRLGNTPAICRKSYVHPEIVGAYLDGSLIESLRAEIEEELRQELEGLVPEEVAVLVFLQQRLAHNAGKAEKAAA